MRTDDRRAADLERRHHRLVRNVREIDHHAQAVHFAHDLPAKGRQAVVERLVGAGIGPVVVLDVSQSHVARAQRVAHAQDGQGIVDRMTAFQADERGDLSLAVNADHVVGGKRCLQCVGIAGDEPMDTVDLLQQSGDGFAAPHGGGNIDGPKLAAHAAGFQALQIRRHRRGQVGGVGSRFDAVDTVLAELAKLPGQVVVAVDQWSFLEDYFNRFHLNPNPTPNLNLSLPSHEED